MLKFGSKKFSDVRWDSNLRCQDNDLIKSSISKNHKSSNILLCANFRKWDAIVFGSPMLCGRIGYGVVLLQWFAHSLFEPWKWSFLLSKIQHFENSWSDLQLSIADFSTKNVRKWKNILQTFHNTFQSIQKLC